MQADSNLSTPALVLMTWTGVPLDAAQWSPKGFAAKIEKPLRRAALEEVCLHVLAKDPLESLPCDERFKPKLKHWKGHPRILLAEDNRINQRVALGILKRLGLKADAVANGLEAIQALTDLPYDLVLMDCQMPEMDGYEATQMIRNPQSKVLNHDVPIIALTANAMRGDREECLAAGMNDYVTKPIDRALLESTLQRWLPTEEDNTTRVA